MYYLSVHSAIICPFSHAEVQRLGFTQKIYLCTTQKTFSLIRLQKKQKKQHKIVHMTYLLYYKCSEGIQQLCEWNWSHYSLKISSSSHSNSKLLLNIMPLVLKNGLYHSQMQFKYGQNFINWLQKTLINNLVYKLYCIKSSYIIIYELETTFCHYRADRCSHYDLGLQDKSFFLIMITISGSHYLFSIIICDICLLVNGCSYQMSRV